MLANLLVSSAVAVAASPSTDFKEYGLCLQSAASVASQGINIPIILVMARAIEFCAKEREKLLQQLIVRQGTPEGQGDAALIANEANRNLVDFEIERIRALTEGAFVLPSHSHRIIFEEKLLDAPNQ